MEPSVFIENFKNFTKFCVECASKCEQQVRHACERFDSVVSLAKKEHFPKLIDRIYSTNFESIFGVKIEKGTDGVSINTLSLKKDKLVITLDEKNGVFLDISNIFTSIDDKEKSVNFLLKTMVVIRDLMKIKNDKDPNIATLDMCISILETIVIGVTEPQESLLTRLTSTLPLPENIKQVVSDITSGGELDIAKITSAMGNILPKGEGGEENNLADMLVSVGQKMKSGKDLSTIVKEMIASEASKSDEKGEAAAAAAAATESTTQSAVTEETSGTSTETTNLIDL